MADQRGEEVGKSVGYKIGQGDHVDSRDSKITFVTVGYLLQYLSHNSPMVKRCLQNDHLVPPCVPGDLNLTLQTPNKHLFVATKRHETGNIQASKIEWGARLCARRAAFLRACALITCTLHVHSDITQRDVCSRKCSALLPHDNAIWNKYRHTCVYLCTGIRACTCVQAHVRYRYTHVCLNPNPSFTRACTRVQVHAHCVGRGA